MKSLKHLIILLAFVFTTVFLTKAQFVGPAPLIVPTNNYAFAWSPDGTTGALTTYGLYFKAGTTTPGFEFRGAAGAKLVNVNSIAAGNREAGDITFGNTGSLIVNPNRYAFRFSLTNSYGLFFNATGLAYEFRTADASPVFSIGANSGDVAMDGTATIGSVPKDNALTEVLVKDATGLVHYRDAATLGGGGFDPNYAGFLQLSKLNSGDRNTIIDFHSHGTNAPYGLRIIRGPGVNGGTEIGHVGASIFRLRAWSTGSSLRFNVGNQGDIMTISDNQNVGIGTTTPGAKLQVASTGSTIDAVCNTTSGIVNILRVRTNVIEGLVVKSSGNVGIGTLTPTEKLTVKGTIRCSELNVVDIASIPDYVFKEDYDLMSLEEVSKFIDENGHLPNIPNEKEVRAEGVNIGELNMKLLEKIEELTLHMIEKDAQVRELKSSLKEKDAQFESIQQQLDELKAGNH